MNSPADERLAALCRSLDAHASTTPLLERLRLSEAPEGCSCALRHVSAEGAVAVLEVEPDRVTVTTRSEDLHPEAGDSEIVDELGVDLSRGWAWDDVRCDTPDELAGLLVKHLYRRVKDVDPEPRIPAGEGAPD